MGFIVSAGSWQALMVQGQAVGSLSPASAPHARALPAGCETAAVARVERSEPGAVTRDATGGWYPVHGLGQTLDVTVAPPGAKAVTGTITLVAPMRTSHLQAWSCGEQPENSNVNALAGRVLANFVTTGTTPEGKLCIFAINTGQTLFDTTGWWVE